MGSALELCSAALGLPAACGWCDTSGRQPWQCPSSAPSPPAAVRHCSSASAATRAHTRAPLRPPSTRAAHRRRPSLSPAFVRAHPALIQNLERLAHWVAWSPDRFSGSEFAYEAFNAGVGLAGLYHDTILNGELRPDAGAGTDWGFLLAALEQVRSCRYYIVDSTSSQQPPAAAGRRGSGGCQVGHNRTGGDAAQRSPAAAARLLDPLTCRITTIASGPNAG